MEHGISWNPTKSCCYWNIDVVPFFLYMRHFVSGFCCHSGGWQNSPFKVDDVSDTVDGKIRLTSWGWQFFSVFTGFLLYIPGGAGFLDPSTVWLVNSFVMLIPSVYPVSFDQEFTDIKTCLSKRNMSDLSSGEAFLLTKNSYLCFAIDTCTWNYTLGRGYTEESHPPAAWAFDRYMPWGWLGNIDDIQEPIIRRMFTDILYIHLHRFTTLDFFLAKQKYWAN